MSYYQFDFEVAKECVRMSCSMLEKYKSEVDKINVFPVPDGDTGENMLATMEAVLNEIEALPDTAKLSDFAEAVRQAGRGAEGNSGNILTNWLQSFCEFLAPSQQCLTMELVRDSGLSEDQAKTMLGYSGKLDPIEGVETETLTKAFRFASDYTYKALFEPRAGTMLDVMNAVASVAEAVDDSNVSELFEYIVKAAWKAVDNTPNRMEVLRKNKVVDSGAVGFALIIEASFKAICGSPNITTQYEALSSFRPPAMIDEHVHEKVGKYQFCTQMLVTIDQAFDEEQLYKFFKKEGDSVVWTSVGNVGEYKLHIHTDKPDFVRKILELRGFTISQIKASDMARQAQERNRTLVEENKLHSGQTQIITDTGSDLTKLEQSKYGFTVLEIKVRDNHSTTAVAQMTWYMAARKLLDLGKDVIIITLSSSLSSTFINAQQAVARLILEYPDRQIACVDSLAGSRGQAWLCLEARRLLDEGRQFSEVVKYITEIRHQIQIFVIIGDSQRLVEGGRLPELADTALTNLNLVPLIHLTADGRLKLKKLVRRKKIIEAMLARFKAVTNRDSIVVASLYSENRNIAEHLSAAIAQQTGQVAEPFLVGGPIYAHIGPSSDTVAFVVIGKPKK